MEAPGGGIVASSADLLVFGLFLVPLLGVLAYGWRFRDPREAEVALERARANVSGFRWALGLLLAGVVVLAEGQAIKWLGGFSMSNPWVLTLHVGGYVLVSLGFLLLHRVLGGDVWEA